VNEFHPFGVFMDRAQSRIGKTVSDTVWFLLPFLTLILVWKLSLQYSQVPERIFPSIESVWAVFIKMSADGSLWKHVLASLQRVLIGTLIAVMTAIPFGILMGINRYAFNFFTPILRFSVSLAGIAWIPLATLWFGYGNPTVIFIIFNAVFFSLVYNTMMGVGSIPNDLYRAAQSLGANRLQVILEVVLPGAFPQIVTGLRVGMGFAWRGLFAAEMIATNLGLGYLLFLSREFYETNKIIMSMILIGIFWLIMDRLILSPLERHTIVRWGLKRGEETL
jgi:NitT/TauT family transport system permease protein/taurine transport system permease protein